MVEVSGSKVRQAQLVSGTFGLVVMKMTSEF